MVPWLWRQQIPLERETPPTTSKSWQNLDCKMLVQNYKHCTQNTISHSDLHEITSFHPFYYFYWINFFQCDGILCDGPSRENAISTVVDCRDIDNGNLAFFRIGLTPKSTILNIFETLLKKHGKMPKSDTNGIIQVNGAYEKEINE